MKPCKRRFKSPFVLLAVVAFAFSACAGQPSTLLPAAAPGSSVQGNAVRIGSAASSGQLLPSNGPRRPADGSYRPMTAGGESLTVTGQIMRVASGGFLINVSQGCISNGNSPRANAPIGVGTGTGNSLMIVATNSATRMMGGLPAAGLYAEAIGTGSCTLLSTPAPLSTAPPAQCVKSSISCGLSLYPSVTAARITLSRVPLGQTSCSGSGVPLPIVAKTVNPPSSGGSGCSNCGSSTLQTISAPASNGAACPQPCSSLLNQAPGNPAAVASPAPACSPSAANCTAVNPSPCPNNPSPAASAPATPTPPGSPAPAVSSSAPAPASTPTASPTPGPPH
jgi:hypothetical protein